MASELPASRLVPFCWPSSWADPELIALVKGSAVNCLVFGEPAGTIAAAARGAGFAVRDRAMLKADPELVAIDGLVWPRIRPLGRKGRDQADSGPTSAPWIDSNSSVAMLALARNPGKPIWLDFAPPPDAGRLDLAAYRLAIADTEASGARWTVRLDAQLSQSLAAGDPAAGKTWRGILDTLAFFEEHRAWRSYRPDGPLGVASTFSGQNAFLAMEFLNLAARRNLLYRIIERSSAWSANLSGLRAVLWLDSDRPTARLVAKLSAFAGAGGRLIVPRSIAAIYRGERLLDCPVAGYDLRAFGKGSIAAATQDWDDPYWLAADVHDLAGRRYDPFRLFNGASCWAHYSIASQGQGSLIQLVRFGGRPSSNAVSLRILRPHRSVVLHLLEADSAVPLPSVQVEKQTEYQLPQFATYAALEVRA